MATKTVRVELHTIEDEETGSVFILPTEREIEESERRLSAKRKDIAQQLEGARNKRQREIAEAQIAICDQGQREIERLRATRKEKLSQASVRVYQLRKPTYGEYLEAESEAKKLDEATGEVSVDNAALMQQLLPLCLTGLTEDEKHDLEPNLAFYLWGRLQAMMFPDNNRLPFISQPALTP